MGKSMGVKCGGDEVKFIFRFFIFKFDIHGWGHTMMDKKT
jgi:hypothetical protein